MHPLIQDAVDRAQLRLTRACICADQASERFDARTLVNALARINVAITNFDEIVRMQQAFHKNEDLAFELLSTSRTSIYA